MNKLKNLYTKYQSRITISLNKQPLLMTLLGLFLINMVILVIASLIAPHVAPELYANPIEAFAQGSIRWMITPYSILELEGNAGIMMLAGTVVVIEMVLFTGTIIAMTTNTLKEYFTKRGQAQGKLVLIDHILILNWNNRVAEIIIDLMHKGERITVMLLSEKDKDYVKGQIQSAICCNQKLTNKLDLVVRQGDPFSRSDLEDISITNAKSIVIMSDETKSGEAAGMFSKVDLNALKLLLLIGSFNLNKDCNIVVEVEKHDTVTMLDELSKTVDSLKNKLISSLSFNRKLGYMLAQSVYQPGLASVYMDLLSFKGDEFYPTEKMDIDNYLANFTESIPIINYDKLYVLASDDKKLKLKRSKPYYTNRILARSTDHSPAKTNLFIFGDSKKREYMLENLSRKADIVKTKVYDTYGESTIDFSKLATDDASNLIMILSDDRTSPDNYDANVFCTLVNIHKQAGNNKGIQLITEILDPRNLNSVGDFNVKNTIISNKLISLVISQLLSNEGSKQFYDAMFLINNDGSGFDIVINHIEELFDLNQDLTFNSKAELINSVYYSLDKKYMLIGYIQDGKNEYLAEDMDVKHTIKLKGGDRLILIKY